ncbi:MAG: SurA N-terminal domain-containing protein, partial [Bacteroidaceae bacterium]
MATLGKIRSKGPLLVIIVGGALLAFIAQAAFEGMNANRRSAEVGEIYGDKLSAMDYQNMVEEYTNVVEFTTQGANLSE